MMTRFARPRFGAFVLAMTVASGCASGLTPELKRHITFKVEDRRVALVDCYTRALALNPTLQADMVIAFEIREETKRLRSVRVKQGAGISPDLERCIVEELRDVQLDKAPDVRIQSELPVQFTPMVSDVGGGGGDFSDDDEGFDDDFDEDDDLK